MSFHLLMATLLLLHLYRLHAVQFDEPPPLSNDDTRAVHGKSFTLLERKDLVAIHFTGSSKRGLR